MAAAAIGEVGGRNLATRKNVSAAQAAIRLPKAAVPAPPLPKGVNLPVPGITPFITPNGQFYRVDTALIVPQVDPSNWTLRIHGMVAREVVITFDQLLRRPLIEDYLTLCCVSNPVDGPYIGNAKWLGASLASLIRSAGPLRGAEQLLCTSVDGFTSGVPLVTVLDGRDSLVAVAMNGTVLPTEHGFPARLVVPGLYGYVSACKWVVDIEVTTWAAQAYWVPLGWSQQAPIKTESRIDVPASGAQVKAGKTAVAGVAWAQHKGIEAVEVRVDSGPWHEATLAAVPDLDTWRQWVWEWDATVRLAHDRGARDRQDGVHPDVGPGARGAQRRQRLPELPGQRRLATCAPAVQHGPHRSRTAGGQASSLSRALPLGQGDRDRGEEAVGCAPVRELAASHDDGAADRLKAARVRPGGQFGAVGVEVQADGAAVPRRPGPRSGAWRPRRRGRPPGR